MRRLAAGLMLACLPAAALAQGDTHPLPPWADTLIAPLVPYVAVALGTAMTAAVGILVAYLNQSGRKIGVEITATQAAKLNQALTNAAGGLIQRLGPEVAMKVGPGHPDVQAYAERIADGLGAEIKELRIDPETIGQRVLEEVPQVLPVDGAPIAIAVAPAGEPGPVGPVGPAGKGKPA